MRYAFIKQHREVTDEPQYLPEVMCKEKYFMDEKDKSATNFSSTDSLDKVVRSNRFMSGSDEKTA